MRSARGLDYNSEVPDNTIPSNCCPLDPTMSSRPSPSPGWFLVYINPTLAPIVVLRGVVLGSYELDS